MFSKSGNRKKGLVGYKKRRRYRRFWGRLCVEFYDVMLMYARRLVNGNQDRAEVLVQTTVTRALTYCPKPDTIKNPKGYLLQTIRNEWIRGRNKVIEVDFATIREDPRINVLNRQEFTMDLFDLRASLDALKTKAGINDAEFDEMWNLFAQGMSFDDVAALQGKDVKRIRHRWYYYLSRMKAQLRKDQQELEEKRKLEEQQREKQGKNRVSRAA